MSAFYSAENAHGLLFGYGNVGKYLSTKPEDKNTYMSRDGGLTWIEVFIYKNNFKLF